MPKRFTDTDKWKKPFIRTLQGPYKLLWLYILDDCDHAGIWQVDFEVARIRIGEQVDKQTALNIFADRIEVFGGGSKWFIKDFIDFQYGQLSEKNRLHQSVLNILQKNELGVFKPLTRGQGTIQGQGQGIGQGKGEPAPPKTLEWFIDQFDQIFLDQIKMTYPGKDIQQAAKEAYAHLAADATRLHNAEASDCKRLLNTWLSNQKVKSNGTSKTFSADKLASIIESRGYSKGATE